MVDVQALLLYLTATASKTLQIRNEKLNSCEQKWTKRKSPTLHSAKQN